MSSTNPSSADDRDEHQSATASSGKTDKPKPNFAVRMAKGTGKALWYGTAADVIVRDTKRVRPLNPGLWKDVFGPKGLNAFLTLLGRRKAEDSQPINTANFGKGALSALSSILVGGLVAVYGFNFGTTLAGDAGIPVTNKIIALCLTATGIAFAFINTLVLIFLIRKKLAQQNSRPPRAR